MKQTTCTLYGGPSPPYENVHVVFFFRSYFKETKIKTIVSSYNLISHIFI